MNLRASARSERTRREAAMINLQRELEGDILDIGGGGEGVIGRLYGAQVVAIDNCPEELAEAPDGFRKCLMDAAKMTFESGSFDHVTAFYALMFMDEATQQKALYEAARVLKPNGDVQIWDCSIASAYPEPFCVDVAVSLSGHELRTTYGIGKTDAQSLGSIARLCENAGLQIEKSETNGVHFYLKCRKLNDFAAKT